MVSRCQELLVPWMLMACMSKICLVAITSAGPMGPRRLGSRDNGAIGVLARAGRSVVGGSEGPVELHDDLISIVREPGAAVNLAVRVQVHVAPDPAVFGVIEIIDGTGGGSP